MPSITTERLRIEPTHTNCWSVFDQLDDQMIGKLFFKNQWFNIILKPQSLHLGVATEASYGLMKAINSNKYKAKTDIPHAQLFLQNMGFVPQDNHFQVTTEALTCPDLYQHFNAALNIETETLQQPRYNTTAQLVDVGNDCFERPAKLHPQAANAWTKMQQAAANDGIELQLVSAYRSLPYQAALIQKKLDAGQQLADILKVNAAPGHSEHHTGRAIDLNTVDCEPLAQAFENTDAFGWLQQHGQAHGFAMSYPEDNDHGIIYEPWHWCYHHKTGQ